MQAGGRRFDPVQLHHAREQGTGNRKIIGKPGGLPLVFGSAIGAGERVVRGLFLTSVTCFLSLTHRLFFNNAEEVKVLLFRAGLGASWGVSGGAGWVELYRSGNG